VAADPPAVTATLALTGAHPSPATERDLPAWLPVALTASGMDGQGTFSARGYSLTSWLASLDASMGVTAGPGTIGGIDLAAIPKQGLGGSLAVTHRAALFSGSTAFDTLSAAASVTLGELQLSGFQLGGPAGAMTAAGQVDLVRGVCNLNLSLKPAGGGTALTAVVQGPVGHPTAWIVRGTAMN
jgi:hypothetical protein